MSETGMNLAAKLLELLSLSTPSAIRSARAWVRSEVARPTRDTLLAVLDTIEQARSSGVEEADPEVNRRPSVPNVLPSNPRAGELAAIFSDAEFADRKGLLVFLGDLFGDGFLSPGDQRRSRAELVGKAIRRFLALPEPQQEKMYAAIRRRYLRDRKSTLSGWSAVIAGGK